jgi:hypothetical protein
MPWFIALLLKVPERRGAASAPGSEVLQPTLASMQDASGSRTWRRWAFAEHLPYKSVKAAWSTCGMTNFPRAAGRSSYPIPDPLCTPGGINPSITSGMLRDSGFRTRCVRNCETSEARKHVTYSWYSIHKPRSNSGDHQVCELDHLVPLELGGADGLANIWPKCGPDSTVLKSRYFKVKDRVENYLADEVKAGRIPLDTAQRGIASDWTQFLPAANRHCAAGGRC